MISRAVALLLVVGLIVGSDGSICPPATWLAEGSDYTCTNATNGVLYDGSRIPDCSGDEGTSTTYLHVHEYGEISSLNSLLHVHLPQIVAVSGSAGHQAHV